MGLEILKKFKNTFKSYIDFLKKKLSKYLEFLKLPLEYQLFECLSFLEFRSKNIKQSIFYYSYILSYLSFTDLLIKIIIQEFYNLENNIILNYQIF